MFCSRSFCFISSNLLFPFYFISNSYFLFYQSNSRSLFIYFNSFVRLVSLTHRHKHQSINSHSTKCYASQKRKEHSNCVSIVAPNLNNLRKCLYSGAIDNFRFHSHILSLYPIQMRFVCSPSTKFFTSFDHSFALLIIMTVIRNQFTFGVVLLHGL